MTTGYRAAVSPPDIGIASIPKILIALFLAMAGMLGALQMNAPTASAQDIDPTSWADVLVDGQVNPPANSGHLINVVGPAGDASGIVCHVEPLDQDVDVSLGPGGWVTVQFTDNALTGSGDDAPDLFIHETGGQVEEFQVFISQDGATWIDIGQVAGQPTSIDIDQFGYDEGDFFSFVRVEDRSTYVDDPACIGRAGVDIAGIRALSSTAIPALDLVKTNNVEDGAGLSVGDEVTYTFAVTNTGAFDLTNVTVTDPLPNLSDITPASADIAVGETVEFTATYQVTQDDIDAGQIINTATATGVPPQGYTGEPPTAEDDNTIVIPQDAALTLVKTSDVADDAAVEVGDEITYTFSVVNTGNVTLTDVTVTDELEGLSDIDPASIAALAPGETGTFTATYVVTEADVLAGSIVNSATGTGTPPESCVDCDPTSPPDTVTIVTEEPDPALTLVKAANTEGPVALGDIITYTFTATNTGNLTLTDVIITDELPGLTWVDGPNVGTLAPGQSAEGTATYVVTEADVLAGEVVNAATGTGTPPGGCIDCEPATSTPPPVTVIIEDPDPALAVTKTADTEGPVAAGDTVTYSFVAENTGNVTLTDVIIGDELPGLEWVAGPNVGTIAPGETATGTATYVVTEADILAGGVTNVATGTGTPPEACVDCAPPTSPPSTVTVEGEDPAPALALVKTADTEGPVALGDTITYTFTVTNTGNVTLTDVTIADELAGLEWIDGPNVGTLAPGESAEGIATYAVTEADVLAGGVANSATGTGTPPGELTPPTTPPSEVYVPSEDPQQGLTLAKVADTEGPVAVGQTITYTFTATNTGNVTLTDVVITDELPGLSWVTGPELGTLAPGEMVTGSATYVVTESDIVAGSVVNSATATGNPPGELVPPTTPPSTVTIVTDDATPAMTLIKTADTEGPVAAGDVITYSFVATNTGNVTLADVTVADGLAGLEWLTGPNLGTLAPGEFATGTATYTVTQADILAGGVTNSATGTGTPPGDLVPPTTPPSEVYVPGEEPGAGLTLVKAAEPASGAALGDTITYTFAATNTGNVTLTDVVITDELPGLTWVEGPEIGTLEPGQTATGTATYVVTQADVNAGGVFNSATGTGTPPEGCVDCDPTSPPSEVFVPIEATSGLSMLKSVSPDTTINAGETLTYTFVVTNTGTTTVDNVTVTDPLPGLSAIEGPHGISLEPGEQATFTATYVVTETDAIAGIVLNTATATGTGTDGGEISAVDSVQIRACMVPGMTMPTEEADDETTEPVEEAPVVEDAIEEDPNAIPIATPVVPGEEPTEEPVVEEPVEIAPQVLEPLEDCEPLPVDPDPEPTPAPQTPGRPGGNTPGGGSPGGSTPGGNAGSSAPPVTTLPTTGQGPTTDGMNATTVALVAAGLSLVLGAGVLTWRKHRLT